MSIGKSYFYIKNLSFIKEYALTPGKTVVYLNGIAMKKNPVFSAAYREKGVGESLLQKDQRRLFFRAQP